MRETPVANVVRVRHKRDLFLVAALPRPTVTQLLGTKVALVAGWEEMVLVVLP